MRATIKALLADLTAEHEHLWKQMREDAKRHAALADGGDLGEFMRYPLTRGRMLRSALALVKFWNLRAEYYGEESADALEKELADFIAKLDQLKPPKVTKRRGPRGASAESKELLRDATAAVKDVAQGFGLDARDAEHQARQLARDHLKAKGLLPDRRASPIEASYRRVRKIRKP